jgi:prophage tail gpP-like protein
MTGVTLMVGGKKWTGWEHVEIHRSIKDLAGSFELGITLAPDQDPTVVCPPMSLCAIGYGDQVVLAGAVDKVSVMLSASGHDLTLTGRGRAGDLVDCSVLPPWEYTNIGLDQLVGRLVAPFGMTASVQAPVGAIFDRFTISPGETVHAAISRACKMRSLLPTSDAAGNLLLTQGGKGGRSPVGLSCPGNILGGTAEFDGSRQYSHTQVLAQREGQHEANSDAAAAPSATVSDSAVSRYRPKVVLAEQQGDGAAVGDRAQWQQACARAKGIKGEVTVQGWCAGDDGPLWTPGWTVKVDAPILGLVGDYLLEEVAFELGYGGTLTALYLVHPQSYAPNATDDSDDVEED